jgi:hypothetical protein
MAGNRGGLMERITDSLFEIGMTLSRIEVYMKLFPTARMLELASMIYAAVVDFLQDVIEHFQRSPMRKLAPIEMSVPTLINSSRSKDLLPGQAI